jgi:beta-glucosidase
VPLAPGETKTVSMPLRAERLAYWDAARHAFVVEPGPARVAVGGSSADVRLEATVDVR